MDFVRKRKVNLPLGVLGVVLLAALLYLYVFLYVVHIQASRNYVSFIIDFLGVIFFATIPIVLIYKYLLRVLPEQKILSIDEDGIKIHIGDGCEFSWHEIKSINKIFSERVWRRRRDQHHLSRGISGPGRCDHGGSQVLPWGCERSHPLISSVQEA
jgi:hypothetical protein